VEKVTSVPPVAAIQSKATPKPKKKKWEFEQRQSRFALWLVLPSVVMIFLFIGYPIVASFMLTFSKFTIQKTDWFAAGISNYQTVLSDPAFGSALRFTLAYTTAYVGISMFLGMLIAVLLQQVKYGTTLFRSILFIPTVIPVTMGLLMFQWVLDPNNGILNHFLGQVLGRTDLMHNWLTERQTVFGTLVTVTLWGFGPWILLLAGILAIPKDYYEAARVDGTTSLQEFWYITLPLMRTSILVTATLQVIKALKLFVPIYVLTSGNPAGSTQSLYYLVFMKVNQGATQYTYATTVGWVFTIIVIGITLITTFVLRPRVEK
jgi:multiple sugar transport system permease protein